jgi:hypothetical protein
MLSGTFFRNPGIRCCGQQLGEAMQAAIQNLNVGAQIDRKNDFDLVFTR